MDGIGPKDLNIDSLLSRIENTNPEEIIFALSATMEGDTTNFYLFKKLSNNNIKITTLSRGVSIGAELQYADELTLGRSLLQRQLFNG
jgi:recombination protein RecR